MLTLSLLAVIGLAATTNSTLESEVARNEKSYQQAFYTAELGLASGEATIHALPSRASLNEGTTPGRYAPGALSFDPVTYKVVKNTPTGPPGQGGPLRSR